MAGNYCHDLNSNPFNTGVQLHRTPPHSVGVADEQQPSIFTTQALARCAGSDDPLMLGGYLPAPAIAVIDAGPTGAALTRRARRGELSFAYFTIVDVKNSRHTKHKSCVGAKDSVLAKEGQWDSF